MDTREDVKNSHLYDPDFVRGIETQVADKSWCTGNVRTTTFSIREKWVKKCFFICLMCFLFFDFVNMVYRHCFNIFLLHAVKFFYQLRILVHSFFLSISLSIFCLILNLLPFSFSLFKSWRLNFLLNLCRMDEKFVNVRWYRGGKFHMTTYPGGDSLLVNRVGKNEFLNQDRDGFGPDERGDWFWKRRRRDWFCDEKKYCWKIKGKRVTT